MRLRLAVLLPVVLCGSIAVASEVFLPASGTANGVFFSDARVFNPANHEITIQAYYMPRGNHSNAGEQPVPFTVGPRQTRIWDDIVATLLKRTDVGGIRFVSQDEFAVTQRVYALTTSNCGTSTINPCTLGQFVEGRELSAALTKGVILQLESSEKFRTNIGAANPNAVAAHVTWRLYDRNNVLVATSPAPVEMPPYAVIGPTGITDRLFYNVPANADLSDAWVSFVSDQPLFAYGSVVDNGSNDQTYVPAIRDAGTPGPALKTVTIQAKSWEFIETVSEPLAKGDRVRFLISSTQDTHGFALYDAEENLLMQFDSLTAGEPPVERIIELPHNGRYYYTCTIFACAGSYLGHLGMSGELQVGPVTPAAPAHHH